MHPDSGAYCPVDKNAWATATWEQGAVIVGSSVEFGLYSKNATKVLLEIYTNSSGANAAYDYWMEKGSDNIWRAKIEGIGHGTYYAFRCWGPNWPFEANWQRNNSAEGFIADYDKDGNRFNPNKVLFDPRTLEMSHDKSNPVVLGIHDAGMYGTGGHDYKGTVRRNFDTGKWAPKSIVINSTPYTMQKPQIPQNDAIIYEAHVRGLTKHSSSSSLKSILNGFDGFEHVVNIPEQYRGTYKGAGMMAPYLSALGINTIELLPVHETDNDANPDDNPGGNFWGYMTYGYFAPDRRYSFDKSAGGPTTEFKEMVQALHAEGIEVYLDVVYNHSGEGGTWFGETDSFYTTENTFMRGIDNSTYYCLCNENKSYWESSGCGNNLRCDEPIVREFILDSLEYWIDYMGVDGFRFDLCTILAREYNGNTSTPSWNFNPNAQTIIDIETMASTKNVKVIAEAWDCSGYEVGKFPTGWAEWNGRYRDSIRGYINTGNNSGITQYFNGDYENFNDQGGSEKTVNFICAHDGFTLADLVSYTGVGNAQNEQLLWPFGPSDGGNGDQNTPAKTEKVWRRQAIRNFATLQMFSRGVPMIVYGDEFGRTQNGNNNPYNIDSVCTWNNYNMINTDTPQTASTDFLAAEYHNNLGTYSNIDNKNGNFVFFQYLMNLRKTEPGLTQPGYDVQIDYKHEDGTSELVTDARCIWMKINGSSVSNGNDYLVFSNMWQDEVAFTVPTAHTGKKWVRIVDTAKWAESNYNCWDDENAITIENTYGVNAWSIVVLKQIIE